MKILVTVFCAASCLSLLIGPMKAQAAPLAAGAPSIRITSPANGAVIHGSSVTVQVAVSNFKLVPPVLLPPSKWSTIPLLKGNQGHIHYVLDTPRNLVLTRDVVVRTHHTWTHVAAGTHSITAYLATSQHALFPGTQPAVVRVTVLPAQRAGGTTRRVVQAPPPAPARRPAPAGRTMVTLPKTGGAASHTSTGGTPLAPLGAIFLTLLGMAMLSLRFSRKAAVRRR